MGVTWTTRLPDNGLELVDGGLTHVVSGGAVWDDFTGSRWTIRLGVPIARVKAPWSEWICGGGLRLDGNTRIDLKPSDAMYVRPGTWTFAPELVHVQFEDGQHAWIVLGEYNQDRNELQLADTVTVVFGQGLVARYFAPTDAVVPPDGFDMTEMPDVLR